VILALNRYVDELENRFVSYTNKAGITIYLEWHARFVVAFNQIKPSNERSAVQFSYHQIIIKIVNTEKTNHIF
jgi:hypothetical protein